jgi:hypothetical protein
MGTTSMPARLIVAARTPPIPPTPMIAIRTREP